MPLKTAHRPMASRLPSLGMAAMVAALSGWILQSDVARADRSAGQGPPGLILEKAGRYAEAAVYYHRALGGFQEVWIKFWHYGDLSKAHPMCQQAIAEYQDRLKTCLQKSRMDAAARTHMEFVNALWMDEYVAQELGEYKMCFARRAVESENHGDFLFAEQMRQGAADYCRLVLAAYHEQTAAKAEKEQPGQAAFHRKAADECKQQAAVHEMLSRGDKALARLPGLQGPASDPDQRLMADHYFKSYVAYHQRVLSVPGDQWLTGRTPQQVAAILERSGLKHADEAARFASAAVLADIGAKEALVAALGDESAAVRLAAAKALAQARWSDGWAACYRHSDAKVREAVSLLVEPAGTQPLARIATIDELIRGLAAGSADTRAFCQTALERISGEKDVRGAAWQDWRRRMGNAEPGLVRAAPDGAAVVDEMVDFGAWWQSGERSLEGRPNPLLAYPQTATIQWRGSILVTQPGEYRFYVRNHGQESGDAFNWKGESDGAGVLHFTTPSARLSIDGKAVLPDPAEFVEDPKVHMRIDYGKPMKLDAGLHAVLLELSAKCPTTSPWKGQGPSVRLYWSSEHFLRQVIPAANLVHTQEPKP